MEDRLQDEIIGLIGENAYEAFLSAFAGLYFAFPSGHSAPVYEILESVMGIVATNAFREHFGGQVLGLPMSRTWLALRLRRRGHSDKEIAARLRITVRGVRRLMARSGYPAARPSREFVQETERLLQKRQAGQSFAELGKEHGISPLEVLLRLNSYIADSNIPKKSAWSYTDTVSEISALLDAGLSLDEMATRIGRKHSTVLKAVEKIKALRQTDEIIRRAAAGETPAAIAAALDLPQQIVSQRLALAAKRRRQANDEAGE